MNKLTLEELLDKYSDVVLEICENDIAPSYKGTAPDGTLICVSSPFDYGENTLTKNPKDIWKMIQIIDKDWNLLFEYYEI